MSDIKEEIFEKSPHFVQNCIISIFNILAYKKRYSVNYKKFLDYYKSTNNFSKLELKKNQEEKFKDFLQYAYKNSPFYNRLFKSIENFDDILNIKNLPILEKETLRTNLEDVYTVNRDKAVISKTGGTTGKSLEVLYTVKDIEERFAILDNFRGNFGYKLGKKTAWFSGKNLINKKDLSKNRFWKTDYIHNVRYYSTFHIHTDFLKYYIENLIRYQPEFMVGFPSTMYEIAKYGLNNGIDFPEGIIKAIFPTAETITDDIRNTIEKYYKTRLFNQYASSEGAPFILECYNNKLHLELQSGVFEVLDEDDKPTQKGRLIVTSFNTHGTPLIRYDIGDQIELSPEGEKCNCGNNNPLVKQILGRESDFIYSEQMGKINLGNISNCLKGVHGIIRFQIHQEIVKEITVLIEKDIKIYSNKDENKFIRNIRDRVGTIINININYVNEIPVEKSGKFRIVKNSLKL